MRSVCYCLQGKSSNDEAGRPERNNPGAPQSNAQKQVAQQMTNDPTILKIDNHSLRGDGIPYLYKGGTATSLHHSIAQGLWPYEKSPGQSPHQPAYHAAHRKPG